MKFGQKNIYLDNAASTPIDKRVLKKMTESNAFYANPNAIHKKGVEVNKKIEESRKKITNMLSVHSDEIIFTGNATESIAIAILGTVYSYKGDGIPHIVTTNIEHKAVLENFKKLEEQKIAAVTYLSVDENGILNLKELKESLKENTVLVSVGYANSEIGVVQEIEEVARVIRRLKKQKFFKNENYPYFHTDATQAINYLFIKNLEKLGVDLLSFNGSKIYGPKGIGVLYKKRNLNVEPIISGGGQEFGLRPGTESLALISGIAQAIQIAENIKEKEVKRLASIQEFFIKKIKSLNIKFEIIINGSLDKRLPNNINVTICGISNELILLELDAKGVFVSTKSACSASDEDVSHVIKAIREKNLDSLRFSFGRSTTKKDIEYTINTLRVILLKYEDMI